MQQAKERAVRISRGIATLAERWKRVRGLSVPVDAALAAECDADVHAAVNRGNKAVSDVLPSR